jgi:hypothetical protein
MHHIFSRSVNFDGESILFEDSDAATPSPHRGVMVLDSAHNTSIVGHIFHSSIAGSGTVEDIPNARIVTPTGLEEVSSMFDLI